VWNNRSARGTRARVVVASRFSGRTHLAGRDRIPASATMRMVPDSRSTRTLTRDSTSTTRHRPRGVPRKLRGGWNSVGGTSIGSPLVSAMVAVAAQACGIGRLGFINPSLYAMSSTGYDDVTTGSNDLYGVGEYSANVGYTWPRAR